MTPREWILSRFRMPSARKKGGVSTRTFYAGSHDFALDTLDEELKRMLDEGLLGCAQGFWFRREKTR